MNLFGIQLGALGRNAVGIDIGASSIKVVELKREGGKALLKSYGEIALGPYDGKPAGSTVSLSNSKLAEALTDVLRGAGITTKNAGVAIPFRSSLVSVMEMPNLGEKKLEEMIPIEARKYIPVPIAEVTLDWWVIPKEKYADQMKDNKTDVLVVSIHNEILNDYNTIVKANTLNVSFFEIEMFSTARALAQKTELPVMIVDIGALGVKIYIIDRGIIRSSHIINRGSRDITDTLAKTFDLEFAEAEKVKRNIPALKEQDQKKVSDIVSGSLDYVWSEVRTMMANYQTKYEKPIHEVIIVGAGGLLPSFAEVASKKLNVKACLGEPFGKIDTPSVISKTGLEFAVAVGVALRKLEEMH
jgi:type IV pilus assembly protein PilM